MKRDLQKHREAAERFTKSLSLQDKIEVFYGTNEMRESLGLPQLDFSAEAAHGVQARHDQSFDAGEPSFTTIFPNPVGMAASFDKELMHDIGEVVGIETRSLANEGLHNGLCPFAPTVDMERDPRWGRNEEAYGEDPHLTSRMAGEYIRGMAGDDQEFVRCGATLKHFYGNNVEYNRFISDSRMPEDLKEDYYLRVFKEIVEYAQPLSVMTSYNLINGTAATFNPEVKSCLKDKGVPFVVSDAATLKLAVDSQHTAENDTDALKKAFDAGVDMFLEDAKYERPILEEAIKKGIVTEQDLETAVINRLTVYSALGLMKEDRGEDGCSRAFPKDVYNIDRVDTDDSRRLARRAAAESVVLLKNEGMLPVDAADGRKKFAFGPFVDRYPLDWYGGISSHNVTFCEGMKLPGDEFFPLVRIVLGGNTGDMAGTGVGTDAGDMAGAGVGTDVGDMAGGHGDKKYAGIRDGRVVPVSREDAELFRIMLWDESRITIRSVSTGKILTSIPPEKHIVNSETAPESFILYANANDAFSWFTNEAFQFIDDEGEVLRFTPENALHFWEDSRIRGIRNHDGERYVSFETVKCVENMLQDTISEYGLSMDSEIFACFGLHPIVNCKEERDRESIELPPFQRAVVRELRKSFDNIALVLIANAPVAVTEEDEAAEIKSILWTAFGSEELGNGLADVIKGSISPAGRLSQTWYKDDTQLADIEDYDIRKTGMTYLYMKDVPLYRFGYGLTYTTFEVDFLEEKPVNGACDEAGENEYEASVVEKHVNGACDDAGENGCEVYDAESSRVVSAENIRVRVKNTGSFTSDFVVTIYQSEDGELFIYDNDRTGRDVRGRKIPAGSRLVYFERVHDIRPGEDDTVEVVYRFLNNYTK
ncbi:MAG: glycoside hydrolase family 3 C-terminal domain-containing protein [Eubacterium sp.]|nr:glycoside hydrolase family 3 C-terminal domain-containing protein [Eubacterium sp.]